MYLSAAFLVVCSIGLSQPTHVTEHSCSKGVPEGSPCTKTSDCGPNKCCMREVPIRGKRQVAEPTCVKLGKTGDTGQREKMGVGQGSIQECYLAPFTDGNADPVHYNYCPCKAKLSCHDNGGLELPRDEGVCGKPIKLPKKKP